MPEARLSAGSQLAQPQSVARIVACHQRPRCGPIADHGASRVAPVPGRRGCSIRQRLQVSRQYRYHWQHTREGDAKDDQGDQELREGIGTPCGCRASPAISMAGGSNHHTQHRYWNVRGVFGGYVVTVPFWSMVIAVGGPARALVAVAVNALVESVPRTTLK